MERKTKTSEVLRHLQEKGSITSLEAIELYGATRLSAIIFNLRKSGHIIDTDDIHTLDRFNNPVTYAKYKYEGKVEI